MELSRPEYWSGLPFPSPGDLPDPGIEPRSPALQAAVLPSEILYCLVAAAAAAAKSLQSGPTQCDPIAGSPPGSPIPGILQARTLEWFAISFSNAWKWKVEVKPLSRVRLLATPWTAAYQAPPPMGFSRQEYWSGVPLPSPLLPGYIYSFERAHPVVHWRSLSVTVYKFYLDETKILISNKNSIILSPRTHILLSAGLFH